MPTCPAELDDAFYDALGKDYAAEARTVLRHVRRLGVRPPASLLDVACGTGRHVEAFSAGLRCVGVDLDADVLAAAARRCPEVRFVQADMVELDLGERFDVVTCLFASIAYLRTVAQLRRAVRAMARHVEPGGVLVVEPWYRREDWDAEGPLDLLTLDEPERKAVRICRSSRRGDRSVLEFDYLVADHAGVRHLHDRHELRLFRTDQYVGAFEAAGLRPSVDDHGLWGYGLILGVAS
jgi:ubiquinone/menaquinone biosynthesis C-methylase UbiE